MNTSCWSIAYKSAIMHLVSLFRARFVKEALKLILCANIKIEYHYNSHMKMKKFTSCPEHNTHTHLGVILQEDLSHEREPNWELMWLNWTHRGNWNFHQSRVKVGIYLSDGGCTWIPASSKIIFTFPKLWLKHWSWQWGRCCRCSLWKNLCQFVQLKVWAQ